MFLFFKEVIDIDEGLTNNQALRLASNLGFQGELSGYAALQIKRLYNLFIGVDATQVEVNPFGETPDGQGKIYLLILFFTIFSIVTIIFPQIQRMTKLCLVFVKFLQQPYVSPFSIFT